MLWLLSLQHWFEYCILLLGGSWWLILDPCSWWLILDPCLFVSIPKPTLERCLFYLWACWYECWLPSDLYEEDGRKCKQGQNEKFLQRGEKDPRETFQSLSFAFQQPKCHKKIVYLICFKSKSTSLTSLLPIVSPFGKLWNFESGYNVHNREWNS